MPKVPNFIIQDDLPEKAIGFPMRQTNLKNSSFRKTDTEFLFDP